MTSAGDILWQKTFAYPWPVYSYNDAWAVEVDPADKGYIIVADTRPQMICQRDIYVIKTDRYGDTLWTWKNDSASDEAPFNIAIMGDNSFAVCGLKYNYTYKDFYLLVFKPSSPVGPDSPVVPNMIELEQNYPNPFNAATIIKYNLSVAARVNLDIYNYLGQKVTNLVNEDQRPGFYVCRWEAREVSSDIYYCRIQIGDCVQTQKMLILK